MLSKLTIQDFMKELASDSPAPGGGSSAALLGALAASLCSMMASLTVGKKGLESEYEKAEAITERMAEKAGDFFKYMDEDASGFDGVIAAFKLPKGSDEEKKYRSQSIQEGYKAAILPPLKTARLALELFDDIAYIVKNGNPNVVTDGMAGAIGANSAVEMALLNVKINLKSVKDESYVAAVKNEIKLLEEKAKSLKEEIFRGVEL